MRWLREHNYYYGDMKPRNVLIKRDYTIVLGDFGTAIVMGKKKTDGFMIDGYTPGMGDPEVEALII
jgi:serine/threonine protein kinase